MKISDVKVKLVMETARAERLRAFCSLTFDRVFVVHDVRIIEGRQGLFLAMPSRRRQVRCGSCSAKIPSRSRHCPDCGIRQVGAGGDEEGYDYVDIAHPITQDFREDLHRAVMSAYRHELVKLDSGGADDVREGNAST